VEEHWLTFAMEKNKVKDILGEYKRRRYAAKVRLIEGMLAEGDVINRRTAIQKYKANKAVIDGLVKDGIVREQRAHLPESGTGTGAGKTASTKTKRRTAENSGRFCKRIWRRDTKNLFIIWDYRKWKNRSLHAASQ